MPHVPFFSQFETPALTARIAAGTFDLREDPAWAASGAADPEEYARWSMHACGMACLRMILAATRGEAPPTLVLLRASLPYGCYVEDGAAIKGLIYAPFVRYVAAEFGLAAEVVTGVEAGDLPALLSRAPFFIASVHPWIRWPAREPPRRGGHLVLVHRADGAEVMFNNPSGDVPASQGDAVLGLRDFARYFAGRGILVRA